MFRAAVAKFVYLPELPLVVTNVAVPPLTASAGSERNQIIVSSWPKLAGRLQLGASRVSFTDSVTPCWAYGATYGETTAYYLGSFRSALALASPLEIGDELRKLVVFCIEVGHW